MQKVAFVILAELWYSWNMAAVVPRISVSLSFQGSSDIHGRMLTIMEFFVIIYVRITFKDFAVSFRRSYGHLKKIVYQVHSQLVACRSLLLGRSFSHYKSTRDLWQAYLARIGEKWLCAGRGISQYIPLFLSLSMSWRIYSSYTCRSTSMLLVCYCDYM